ncbi:hypothetical protein SLOPH_1866 [Spraguea lophii 42_110]|uniref:FAR-17a/AIG1-like protein n=1 Tax=Spraguea lophii (strain 42_110) TaxID=1358809 RepID=S7WCT0_SPRLO|nr:hypothetical protein SLOPH_1866 [Spraguea lophii 42_110]
MHNISDFSSSLKTAGFNLIRIIFLIALIYGSSTLYMTKEVKELYNNQFGNRHIYLTNISLYLTITTMLLGITVSILQTKIIIDFMHKIDRRIKKKTFNKIYTTALFTTLCLEILVTLLYWPLRIFKPTLLSARQDPEYQTPIFPNHCIHTIPLISMIYECFTRKIIYSRCTRISTIISTGIFSIFYYTWGYISSIYNKQWPYPLLTNMNGILRMIFIHSVCIIGLVLGYGVVNTIIWIKNRFKIEHK